MKCEYCDNEIPFGATSCPACGAASRTPAPQAPVAPQQPMGVPQQLMGMPQQPMGMPQQPMGMPQMNPYGQPYPMPNAPMYGVAPKNRVVYILLAFFIGFFGVHNFYAGRIGPAVAQLLITLFTFWLVFPIFILFIWVIVEMIAVTRDGRGVPFV